MDNVAIIAGQTITVGAVASVLAQWVKNESWFPRNPFVIRLIVALVCVALSAASSAVEGQVVELQTLLEAFFSYTVATTGYDHLFKS